ncbi:MAG: ABC transporter ATP-binding protein [Clostridiales Family XIII bacterium]|jgi:peptide/nickel transport system ATP-binding protein|nr:ABC transporter ATP-binding protein [Clostridiales Family XIII bacterium]
MTQPLIETRNLKKYFRTPYGSLHAVDDINIKINRGETLGVVGESGCGKSTLGHVLVKLLDATDGEIYFEGRDILKLDKRRSKELRTEMQIIFQDPYTSLNPRMTVAQIIAEPIHANKILRRKNEITKRVLELMDVVGLSERLFHTYPHELDGGRRQRIGIARALAVNPKFIVCDEPVSALDVSIQAQILNLLMDLQESMGIAYLFITHDLSVVRHISDEIAVMYLGQCVERAPARELFENPLHPYTKALLKAIPEPNMKGRDTPFETIQGEPISPIDPSPGCRFAARCEYAAELCATEEYALNEVGPNHVVACSRCIR